MRQRRGLSWRYALMQMRADRPVRPAIREERLSFGAGLSAWRGRSGRRYVVTIRPLSEAPITVPEIYDTRCLVALAVRREAGRASIVAVGSLAWIVRSQGGIVREGATELHLYRLAETAIERFEAIEDLREAAPAGADSRHVAREGVS